MRRRAALVSPGLLLAALFAASLFSVPASAAKKVVPVGEYRALVRECRAFLGQRELDPVAAKKLAVRLRAIGSVTSPGGGTIPVDTKSEADALDAISATTPDKKLSLRFAVLDEQLSVASGSAKSDSRLVAERILKAGEFATSQPEELKSKGWDWSFFPKWMKPVENFVKPALNWTGKQFSALGKWLGKGIENMLRGIGKFFRWLFNKFPQAKWNAKNPLASLGNGVLLTLYFLATVAAVVGLYFLLRYLFDLYEIRTGRKRRGGGALGGDLDLSAEGITDPLGTARERAASGDYRAAIRLTYIAALWKLGEGGNLTLEKNRTNWEYQRALRKQAPTLHDELLPATRLFDRVWYGKQKGTEREFALVSAIYDRLPTEVIPASPPAPNSGGIGVGELRSTSESFLPASPPAPPELGAGGLAGISEMSTSPEREGERK